MTITLRNTKGSELTWDELDANFTDLDTNKLDSASYTAADVLTKIKTVDGAGSGLDADTLDGLTSTSFATASHTHTSITEGNSSFAVSDGGTGSLVYTVDGATQMTSAAGSLTFSPTSFRIKGDFSNSTASSRTAFQSSTTNGYTAITGIPNGTSVAAYVQLFGGSDADNAPLCTLGIDGTKAFVNSGITGTGVLKPLYLQIAASTKLTIDTSGDTTINGDQLTIQTAQTPASATATGVAGTICWDTSYIYVCTATNTWKRVAIATW